MSAGSLWFSDRADGDMWTLALHCIQALVHFHIAPIRESLHDELVVETGSILSREDNLNIRADARSRTLARSLAAKDYELFVIII